jgi:signal transduction histidine kinase/DNA-binding response OmpR family regulator/ligand-binding sensor domain-containing protein
VVEAQNKYTVENITVSSGLHDNYIYDVLQDHLGFLWLASENGLQKYDGYTFTLYTPDSSDVTQQNALRLYEDNNNNLWIQMEEGLIRYRRELDDFAKYYFVNSEIDTLAYKVSAIAEDLDSTLWVWIQDKGLYKVNPENKTFISHGKVNKWFEAVKNSIILIEGSEKGIYETWVTFPADYYGLDLYYKFALKRQDGTLEWEPNPNPDNPNAYGNRILTLSGDTLILPAVSFNSNMKNDQLSVTGVQKLDVRPTYVKFRLNLNKFEKPLLKGEEIHIKGNRLPLKWDENITVNCMIFDLQNKLWIGLGFSGLIQFDLETGNYKHFVADPMSSESIRSEVVNDAILDQEGSLWFGGNKGLSSYNPDKESFENYFIDPTNRSNILNHIYRMTDDEQGNIWTISQEVKGLGCFNKLKKEFLHYSEGMDAWISSVTTDRSGTLWLGNWYQGIYKLDPHAKKFSAFSIRKNKTDILEGKRILAVYEDKAGEIWIGGELGGLYRYNRKTGKTSFYEIKDGNFESWLENYIWDIFQDSKGNFWIGTQAGLCSFNPKTGSFKHIQQPLDINLGLGTTAKIHEDASGKLWLVTRNGLLVHFKPDTYETEFYPLNYPVNYSQESPNRSYPDLIEDPRGFLWIGWVFDQGKGGVLKFDLGKKELSFIKQLEKFNISSLCIDDGILWCATNGQGLIRYDTKANTKSFIGIADGLLSNTIQGLEQDTSGNLWLSIPSGLTRYNPKKGTFSHYYKEDGFFTNEFTYSAHSKSRNGEMIFGSLHGVVTFHPDSIKNSKYVPLLVLTDLKIHNESVGVGGNSPLRKHISVSDEVVLAHHQNDITITFASMDFNHPERIKYSFYLENFEKDWRKPGLERTAYYTNLDPGEYVFKVKGTNSDGIWNEAGSSVKIIILPPWWATWWAYTAYIVLIIATLYLLRRYELHRQQLKNELALEHEQTEKLQEIDRMKSRFFANISHEFRTPLTLILGPSERILKKTSENDTKKQAGSIKQNASRLLGLINQLLDLSKLEAGELKLRASVGNIVSFIKGVTLSFESIAERKDITLIVNTTNEEIEMYFDKDKMVKILSNLLSNAFKYTAEGGEIVVSINETYTNSVTIRVKDTGIGIPKEEIPKLFDRFYQVDSSQTREHEGTGIGLAHTKELVELHHGTFSVDSKINEWTEFTIELSLGRDHLIDDEIAEPSEMMEEETIIDEEKNLFTTTRVQTEVSNNFVDDKTQILVVEDNEDVRKYIVDSLSEEHQIAEAENGVEGKRIAEELNPDLIISDIMMPKMDGNELTRLLKNNESTSHIPIILLTAKSEQESKIEGLETGADDYLTKPFDTRELLVRIKNLIEQRKKLQEKFRREITVNPKDITVTSIDEQLLQRAINAVENNISDPDFDTTKMAREVGVSRMLLHTKIKALTGQSTGEFIRTLRLKRAAQLLQQGSGNVTQVAYDVGFQNLSYFAKTFRKQFGKSPSHYPSPRVNDSS